jgi:hypothetical protein
LLGSVNNELFFTNFYSEQLDGCPRRIPVRFAGGITITEPMQYINYQYQALKSTNGNPTASAPYELLKRIVELCKYQNLAKNAA